MVNSVKGGRKIKKTPSKNSCRIIIGLLKLYYSSYRIIIVTIGLLWLYYRNYNITEVKKITTTTVL